MRSTVLVVAFLALILASLGTANAQANGYTTNFVRFPGGTIERTYTGEWQEFSDGNTTPRFFWRETHRDEWSVYLRDDSRSMTMQIDMWRSWISLEWPGHPMADQYQITEADARVNGRLVSEVRIPSGGSFRMVSPGQWNEFNAAGQPIYSFRETGRDQWSVYLVDDSRSMQMQIDMHRGWVRLAWPGHAMADQYRIAGSR